MPETYTIVGAVVSFGVLSGGAAFGVMRWIFNRQNKAIEQVSKGLQNTVSLEACDKRCERLEAMAIDMNSDLAEKLDRVCTSLHGQDGVSGLVKTVHKMEFLIKELAKRNGIRGTP
jgi:hypothetical protein